MACGGLLTTLGKWIFLCFSVFGVKWKVVRVDMTGKYPMDVPCRRRQSQTQSVQVSSTITADLIIPQAQTKVVVACEVHVTEVETARSCAVLG